MGKNKAIFLDRDGVINEVVIRDGKQTSPRSFEEFRINSGINEVLRELKRQKFLNIIITNQPEVDRRLVEKKVVDEIHRSIKTNLSIDDLFVCFHDDRHNCNCRKPKPGLLLEATEKWNIDLSKSFIVGDTQKDVEAGQAAGLKIILIDTFYNQGVKSDYRIKDFEEILNLVSRYIY